MINARICKWNIELEANISRKRNPDAAIEVYDAAKFFNNVLDNPTKYGFKDAISKGDSNECIWQDLLHPTTAMHKVLAADVAKFLTRNEGNDQGK